MTHSLEVENEQLRRRVRVLEEALESTTCTADRLRALVYQDTLTGLPNRRSLDHSFSRMISAGTNPERLAVLFIDLDDFKHINDTFGHQVADALLRKVAERLEALIRSNDILSARVRAAGPREEDEEDAESLVSRLGGDEFVILLPGVRSRAAVGSAARRIVERLEQPFRMEDRRVFVTASVGIALYPSDGRTADVLIDNADAAMYRAKRNGKARYEYYGVAAAPRL